MTWSSVRRRNTDVIPSIAQAVGDFDVRRSRVFAVARSLMATAQITVLLFTPTSYLIVPVAGAPAGPQCGNFNDWTAYCLVGSTDLQWVSWILIAGLVLVISGALPRMTAVLHVWITLSISTAIVLPDGGESAAQLFCVFFLLIALADSRRNHWTVSPAGTSPSPLAPAAWAGWWGLRVQVFWIYVTASIAKFSVAEWADGSAIYYVTRQVFFGVDGPLAGPILFLTEIPIVSLGLTWGSMILELSIAILVLLPYRYRRGAFFLSAMFHVGIIFTIGLWSFGAIMIAGVLATLSDRGSHHGFISVARDDDESGRTVPAGCQVKVRDREAPAGVSA